MLGKVGANESAVPRPLVLGIGGGRTPTNPLPSEMNLSIACSWEASRMSPVVLRKTMTAKAARPSSVKTEASSVATTEKSCCSPRSTRASMPAGIESCRKPSVSWNTNTSKAPSAGGEVVSGTPGAVVSGAGLGAVVVMDAGEDGGVVGADSLAVQAAAVPTITRAKRRRHTDEL